MTFNCCGECSAEKPSARTPTMANKARYIRVSAKNIGVCPKGHPGEGRPAWLFADEIMVE